MNNSISIFWKNKSSKVKFRLRKCDRLRKCPAGDTVRPLRDAMSPDWDEKSPIWDKRFRRISAVTPTAKKKTELGSFLEKKSQLGLLTCVPCGTQAPPLGLLFPLLGLLVRCFFLEGLKSSHHIHFHLKNHYV